MPTDFNTRLWRVYDSGRVLTEESREAWLNVLGRYVEPGGRQTVLDLGAGTGRFDPALAEYCGGAVYAVEPAVNMLRIAKRTNAHPLVVHIQGKGESIPLRNESCDVAFLFLVYHHFSDPEAAIAEVARVLRPGGVAFVRTEFSDKPHRVLWHRYLSKSAVRDIQMYPRDEEVCAALEKAGLVVIAREDVRYQAATTVRDYIRRLRLRPLSSLQDTTDAELQAGLDRLEAKMSHQLSDPVYEVGRVLIAGRGAGDSGTAPSSCGL